MLKRDFSKFTQILHRKSSKTHLNLLNENMLKEALSKFYNKNLSKSIKDTKSLN